MKQTENSNENCIRMDRTEGIAQEKMFLSIVTLFWFAQYVYIPYQTTYLTGLGVSGNLIGMIVGAYGISQLLLRLPVGVCADRIGRHKFFIMTGALASGTASLFRVCYCNGTGFLIGNLLSGLASAMWISYMVFYTGSYCGIQQQKATSRIVMFNNLGMLLGFAASTFCYQLIGMRRVCLLSVLAGGMAFALACFLKEPDSRRGSMPVRQLLLVCTGKRLLLFSLIAMIQQGIQLATTMSFTNRILQECGATDRIIGISSILYMISAVCFAALASSEICCRKGPRFWIPLVLIFVAVYCIVVPAVRYVPVILLFQILPGMATGILFSYVTSEAMKGVSPEQKSTAMGFFQAFYAIGMTAFPMFTGKIADEAGIGYGYLLLAGIAIMGSVLAMCYYRRNREA